MKTIIRKYLLHAAVFIGGLVFGVIIMGFLSMRASKTFLEIFRATYSQEQLEFAAKAHREGNKYAEFVYRNNVVDTLPMGKLKAIENIKTVWTFSFPFATPILDRISDMPDLEKGQKISYAVDLARLAEATENIGLKDEANKLWNESAKLMGHNDISRMRSLVLSLNKRDNETADQSQKK